MTKLHRKMTIYGLEWKFSWSSKVYDLMKKNGSARVSYMPNRNNKQQHETRVHLSGYDRRLPNFV